MNPARPVTDVFARVENVPDMHSIFGKSPQVHALLDPLDLPRLEVLRLLGLLEQRGLLEVAPEKHCVSDFFPVQIAAVSAGAV